MQQEKEKLWAGEVFAEFEKKMEKVAEKSKDKIPALAIDGVHDDRGDGTKEWRADDGLNWWTNGFWGRYALDAVCGNWEGEVWRNRPDFGTETGCLF